MLPFLTPGPPLEIVKRDVGCLTKRVFKNSPATRREFFGSAREIDATFVIYKDEEWSFRDVIEETDKPSDASVYRHGVKVGDRVGIATRNMLEWIIASAAMASIGGISVSLNAGRTEDASDSPSESSRGNWRVIHPSGLLSNFPGAIQ